MRDVETIIEDLKDLERRFHREKMPADDLEQELLDFSYEIEAIRESNERGYREADEIYSSLWERAGVRPNIQTFKNS